MMPFFRIALSLVLAFVLWSSQGVSVFADQSPCGYPSGSEEGPGFDPENVCASYPPQSGPITNRATQDPDQQAWNLFAMINSPDPDRSSGEPSWRHWPEQAQVYPANPDPTNPPQWKDISESTPKFRGHPGLQRSLKFRENPALFVAPKETACKAFSDNAEETRINKDTFDYLIANKLWYVEGKKANFRSPQPVNFPTEAREVKANWLKIQDVQAALGHSVNQSDYLTAVDSKKNTWLLVAFHIVSKETPNWVWATFEHKDNPCYSKYLKAQDSFGLDKKGNVSPSLQEMFKQYSGTKPVPSWWSNYRLDGAQVNFTDETGRPIILGNSVTEYGFQTTASCVTCHMRSTTDSTGQSTKKAHLSIFNDLGQSYNGTPDPKWFYASFDPSRVLYKPLDFLWSVALCPNEIGSTKANCSLPDVDNVAAAPK